jgi:hypothetical protein
MTIEPVVEATKAAERRKELRSTSILILGIIIIEEWEDRKGSN